MKEQDVKELVNKNFMFLTMLGYATSIICELEDKCEVSPRTKTQIDWFKTAIENIVYKDIPAPRMP